MPIPRKTFVLFIGFGLFPWYSEWFGFGLSSLLDTIIQFFGLALSFVYIWNWNRTH
jgi:hypothetical protein